MTAGTLLAQAADLGWLESAFVSLFDGGPVGPLAGLGLLALSAGIGAAHALAPGHGKALMAGYLVGERGRPRDAVTFGVLVAVMHTLSVAAVAGALALLGRTAAARGELPPALALGPWLTLLAGIVVLGVGAGLLIRHARRRRQRPDTHAHEHLHALPDDVPPLSRRGLVLLGASGGLLPSPSAFLVLSTGLFAGRVAFALLLVAAFSVGLAVTITAVGLAVVWGRERVLVRMARRRGRLARLAGAVPMASAALIVGLGVLLVGRGVLGLS